MREAIGGISIFQIVIVLIIIFTAIMSLTINHAKAFGVKDEVLGIIESADIKVTSGNSIGLTDGTITEIINYLKDNGYRSSGKCDDGWTGYNRDGNVTSSRDAIICIKGINVADTYKSHVTKGSTINKEFPSMMYYEIALFYQLDLPVLGNALNLNLKGSTKIVVGD